MTEWLERLRSLIQQRTARERWMTVLALGVVAFLAVQSLWLQPLQVRSAQVAQEIDMRQTQILTATRLLSDVRRLQGQLARVEPLITPGAKTDLLTLLESLAAEAGLGPEQIDSVTPKPPSSNDRYPETRVEVRLKGSTLRQLVQLLHKIESGRLYLIVRSLRITTRGKEQQVLDVSFSVSSFERA